MIDVKEPPVVAPVPVVIHEPCDHHSSWRLWFDRRQDIQTILDSDYPEINSTTTQMLLRKIEMLQTLDDKTFDLYLLNAVKWATQRGAIK